METRANHAQFLLIHQRDKLLAKRSVWLFDRSESAKRGGFTDAYDAALDELDAQVGDLDDALRAIFPDREVPPLPPRPSKD